MATYSKMVSLFMSPKQVEIMDAKALAMGLTRAAYIRFTLTQCWAQEARKEGVYREV